ncbi:hypothetical protein FNV43_RR23280 [Rhamnella rubrinervis]|uniref:Secreted protein n=1 Tax=Rhamnella rubrinervis TaxID=2594499 RepID=A0A8K0DXN3_9ROSA|nr:hypothetical protein FNV43_RR23280 [Rhamnella rubrinervis]
MRLYLNMLMVLTMTVLFLMPIHEVAGRSMKKGQKQQWLASLPKGPVSPSAPSGGTHLPSNINQRAFVGHAAPISRVPPTAFAVHCYCSNVDVVGLRNACL